LLTSILFSLGTETPFPKFLATGCNTMSTSQHC
jgi:hypothetical protein